MSGAIRTDDRVDTAGRFFGNIQTGLRPPSRRFSLGMAAPQPGRGDASKYRAGRVPSGQRPNGSHTPCGMVRPASVAEYAHAYWRDRGANGEWAERRVGKERVSTWR